MKLLALEKLAVGECSQRDSGEATGKRDAFLGRDIVGTCKAENTVPKSEVPLRE